MREIVPGFKVPPSYNKTKLTEKYEVCTNAEKNKFQDVSDICLTTDIWTEMVSEKSFLGITIHYIDGIQSRALNILKSC